MSVDNRYNAGAFSIGGYFIIMSFSLAMATAISLVAGDIQYLIVFLVAGLVGSTGFYNAYRALQETLTKN
jgi:UDP-N-acetylmuramyl pentapeptide phosphotransferase/UDP-N-acetylglucosamine-1-phosphate transferase